LVIFIDSAFTLDLLLDAFLAGGYVARHRTIGFKQSRTLAAAFCFLTVSGKRVGQRI
jgi:hypothetical protein